MWFLSDRCVTPSLLKQKLRYKNKQNVSKTIQFSSCFLGRTCLLQQPNDR